MRIPYSRNWLHQYAILECMHPRVILSLGNFFFSLTTGLMLYVIIPFLSSYIGAAYAGLVVTLAGIIAILSFFYLPRLVARHGAQEIVIVAGIAEMLSLLALAAVPGAVTGIIFITVMLALQPVMAYAFDLLLEATVTETNTVGEVRTIFITAYNIGVCAAPLLLGVLLSDSNEYTRIFIAGAALLVPLVILFAARSLPKGTPPRLSHLRDSLQHVVKDRDLGAVTVAHFLFYLFCIWAPLYVPIYLHTELGISWATLGWMFSLMLVPYVIIEYPAGYLADKFIGDKELMYAGFILAGGALAALSSPVVTGSLWLLLLILIVSRVGAALIESMTEGHFFRRVAKEDIASMSFFRGVWPLANVVGPVIASLLLLGAGYQLFFLIAGGFIVIAGVIVTSLITDFK